MRFHKLAVKSVLPTQISLVGPTARFWGEGFLGSNLAQPLVYKLYSVDVFGIRPPNPFFQTPHRIWSGMSCKLSCNCKVMISILLRKTFISD